MKFDMNAATKNVYLIYFPTSNNNNMASMRSCEKEAILAELILKSWNYVS
jgi:hypothetical protein